MATTPFIPQFLIGSGLGVAFAAAWKIGWMNPISRKMEHALSKGDSVEQQLATDRIQRNIWKPLARMQARHNNENTSAADLLTLSNLLQVERSTGYGSQQNGARSVYAASALKDMLDAYPGSRKDKLLAFGADFDKHWPTPTIPDDHEANELDADEWRQYQKDNKKFVFPTESDDARLENLMGLSKSEIQRYHQNENNMAKYFGFQSNAEMQIMRPVIQAAEQDFHDTLWEKKDSFKGLRYADRKKAEYNSFRPTCKAVFDVPCNYAEFAKLYVQASSYDDGMKLGQPTNDVNITEMQFMKNVK